MSTVNPDGPQSKTHDLGWIAESGLDPSLTAEAFEQAKVNTQFAQADFVHTEERFGTQVALADFNARVLRWAKEFTNPRLSRVAYVLGCAMGGKTHEYAISINGKYGPRKDKHGNPLIAKDKLLYNYRIAYASQDRTISYSQMRRNIIRLDEAGVIEWREQDERQGDSDWTPGAFLPNVTHVNFWCVLKGDELVPHDFFAPLPEPAEIPAEAATQPAESKNGTWVGTWHGAWDGTRHGALPNDTYETHEPSDPDGAATISDPSGQAFKSRQSEGSGTSDSPPEPASKPKESVRAAMARSGLSAGDVKDMMRRGEPIPDKAA